MDPFLMLDELRSTDSAEYIGGFPPHPHRGIETLTYMLAGGFVHEDTMGNRAELRDGGVQWMSAGSGVIHSELPLIRDGLLHGFQLWINLPRDKKMQSPTYRQADRDQLPVKVLENGSRLQAICGEWDIEGDLLKSPILTPIANARVLDVSLAVNATLQLSVPPNHAVFAYMFSGALATTPPVTAQQFVYFTAGDVVELRASEAGARLLLLAGTPLAEPIAQYGPFVMNTEAEIQQAIEDYRQGRLVQS
jgi:redox-sensitive bicupin YhaK (pirin superfamily)